MVQEVEHERGVRFAWLGDRSPPSVVGSMAVGWLVRRMSVRRMSVRRMLVRRMLVRRRPAASSELL